MQLETKYDVGTHIWVVYEHHNEACVYDTYIEEIAYARNGLVYITDDCVEVEENDVVLYEDDQRLRNEIIKVMVNIHEKKGENKDE